MQMRLFAEQKRLKTALKVIQGSPHRSNHRQDPDHELLVHLSSHPFHRTDSSKAAGASGYRKP